MYQFAVEYLIWSYRGYDIAFLLVVFMALSSIYEVQRNSVILREVCNPAIAKYIRGSARKKRSSEVIGATNWCPWLVVSQ